MKIWKRHTTYQTKQTSMSTHSEAGVKATAKTEKANESAHAQQAQKHGLVQILFSDSHLAQATAFALASRYSSKVISDTLQSIPPLDPSFEQLIQTLWSMAPPQCICCVKPHEDMVKDIPTLTMLGCTRLRGGGTGELLLGGGEEAAAGAGRYSRPPGMQVSCLPARATGYVSILRNCPRSPFMRRC